MKIKQICVCTALIMLITSTAMVTKDSQSIDSNDTHNKTQVSSVEFTGGLIPFHFSALTQTSFTALEMVKANKEAEEAKALVEVEQEKMALTLEEAEQVAAAEQALADQAAQEKADAEKKAKEKEKEEADKKAKATTDKKTTTSSSSSSSSTPSNSNVDSGSSSSDGSTLTLNDGTVISYSKSIKVKAYAYCDTGKTASGAQAGPGLIAVDPKVIPLGTKLYVPGYGICYASDTGGNIKGNTIDVWFSTDEKCRQWGVQYPTIYIIN